MVQKIVSIKAALCCVGCLFAIHAQADNVDNLKHQIYVDLTNGKKLIEVEKYGAAAQALSAAAHASRQLAEELATQHEEAGDYHKAAGLHAQLGDLNKSATIHERASRLASRRGHHEEAKKHITLAINYREALERNGPSSDASDSWNEGNYDIGQ